MFKQNPFGFVFAGLVLGIIFGAYATNAVDTPWHFSELGLFAKKLVITIPIGIGMGLVLDFCIRQPSKRRHALEIVWWVIAALFLVYVFFVGSVQRVRE